MDTLLTFLKLLHLTPDCFPTPMLSQSTGVLVPRSRPLHLPQSGPNAYLALFHLTAFELNCSGRRDEGSGGKERGNEPKLQLDNKLCSLKMPQIKFFFSDIFSVSYEKTINHSQAIQIYLSVCVCVCVCVRARTCTHSAVSDPVSPWTDPSPPVLLSMEFSGKNTGVGYHFLLKEIFPTRGLNPPLLHLLHWQADSLPPRYLGSPYLSFLVRNLFKFSFK